MKCDCGAEGTTKHVPMGTGWITLKSPVCTKCIPLKVKEYEILYAKYRDKESK